MHERVAPQLSGEQPAPRRRWWQRRAVRVLAAIMAGVLLTLVIAAEYVLHNLEPIVRRRVIQTLSESFNSPVELDALHISLFRGIEVSGEGLRIPYGFTPANDPARHIGPLLSVQHFRFRTTFSGLLHHTTQVDEVHADGVEIHIPPHDERNLLLGTKEGRLPADPTQPRLRPRIAFTVAHVDNQNVRLFIEPDAPGKQALEFDLPSLEVDKLGPEQAATFTADLVNARPRGDIHTSGRFGPWASDDPRETPVDGDFTFTHADLSTIRGIGGMLAGAGHYSGKLDALTVDGSADVPDFSLDTAHHPMPLHTRFHAVVDGTTGDTTLQPVQARLGRSDFTTSGKVVKVPGGHDIALEVNIPSAQAADFLDLAMRTSPPLLTGTLDLKAKLHIPPGPERVPIKLGMTGQFSVRSVHFSNLKFQNRIDGLSARAQGHPEEAKSVSSDQRAEAASDMSANFTLGHGLMTASDVNYTIPGATVQMNGVYAMDGNLFEFKGHVRTQATASQMVGGWRGLLLLPLDRLLQKNGAGVELPIEVSGTAGDVHVGLALQGADDTPQQMQQDLRKNRSAILSKAGRSHAQDKEAR